MLFCWTSNCTLESPGLPDAYSLQHGVSEAWLVVLGAHPAASACAVLTARSKNSQMKTIIAPPHPITTRTKQLSWGFSTLHCICMAPTFLLFILLLRKPRESRLGTFLLFFFCWIGFHLLLQLRWDGLFFFFFWSVRRRHRQHHKQFLFQSITPIQHWKSPERQQ